MAEFPPKHWTDIFAYYEDEVVAGYREYRPDEPEPGPNRSPGYRWGWANRKGDTTGEPDGLDHVRRDYIRATPGPFATTH